MIGQLKIEIREARNGFFVALEGENIPVEEGEDRTFVNGSSEVFTSVEAVCERVAEVIAANFDSGSA